jgi:hypothetical protein
MMKAAALRGGWSVHELAACWGLQQLQAAWQMLNTALHLTADAAAAER